MIAANIQTVKVVSDTTVTEKSRPIQWLGIERVYNADTYLSDDKSAPEGG